MKTQLFTQLNSASNKAAANATPAGPASDHFAHLLQSQRERVEPVGASLSEPRRGTQKTSTQQSSRVERNGAAESQARGTEISRSSAAESNRANQGSSSVPNQDVNGSTPSSADSATDAHFAAPTQAAQTDTQHAHSQAEGELLAQAGHALVNEIHDLTSQSRLLAAAMGVFPHADDAVQLSAAEAQALQEAFAQATSALAAPVELDAEALLAEWQNQPEVASQSPLAALEQALLQAGVAPQQVNELVALAAQAWQSAPALPAAGTPTGNWQAPLATELAMPNALAANAALTGLPVAGDAAASANPELASHATTATSTLLTANQASTLAAGAHSEPAGELPTLSTGLAPAVSNPVGNAIAPASLAVTTPLSSPQWGQHFSQQVLRLSADAGQGLRHAELRLDPPDLGPVRITLSLAGEQASAAFLSPHAAVRSAIEQALPQLQQALAEAGIQLGETSVGEQENPAEHQVSAGGAGLASADAERTDHSEASLAAPGRPSRGLVDTFA